MTIELLHRGRFDVVATATAKQVSSNAWSVRLPFADRAVQRSRRPATDKGWDGAVLAIDGQESEPGVVSAIDARAVTLSVWVI